jgi:hypothetical protein
MLYQICPRCHFRLLATKHICSTCGQMLQGKTQLEEPVSSKSVHKEQPATRSFWKSLFGIAEEPAKERHEEPALGET